MFKKIWCNKWRMLRTSSRKNKTNMFKKIWVNKWWWFKRIIGKD